MFSRVSLAALILSASTAAWAQAPSETGTGGGPASTARAPNTTAVGQTKPPGSAAAPEGPQDRQRRDEIEKKNDAIQSGICIGCDK